MDDKQKKKLDVVSGIDDDIIEKSTKKRIALLAKMGRKKRNTRLYITIGSIAAAFAIVLTTVLILVNSLGKQVPIYTGMTVSNELSAEQLSAGNFTVLELNAEGNNGNHYGQYKGDYKHDPGDLTDPFDKPLEDSLTVVGAGEQRYYAGPGEDVYITVHLDNSDDFEILSFTLNGEKYSSYMFEDGSDMENLILKVNVGTAEGLVEYTIDAIKYIDGTEIKDVRMEGDQTVEVGVYTEKQPTAAIKGELVDFNSISFTVSADDLLGLVEMSDGKLEVVLYDGESILSIKDIATKGETNVTLYRGSEMQEIATTATSVAGLEPNTDYRLVATYKNGENTETITLEFTTAPLTYTVNYLLAKVDGSGYVLDRTETVAVDKGATFAPEAISYEGFAAPEAQSLVAAVANNGAVINYEYTRNSYTLNLQNSGVTDIQNLTFGATLATPEKEGYTFNGWFDTDGVQHLTVPAKNTTLHATWAGEATADDLWWEGTSRITITGVKNVSLTDLVIPAYINGAPVTDIDEEAFWGCTHLRSITLPSTVKRIRDSAFWECDNLTAVTLSSSLNEIGAGAFKACTALTNVIWEGTISDWARIEFADAEANPLMFCHKLTIDGINVVSGELTLTGATKVGTYAFAGCTALTKITLPSSITEIGASAFFGCSALTNMTIPFVGSSASTTVDDLYQYPFAYIFGTVRFEGSTMTYPEYIEDGETVDNKRYYVPSTLRSVTVTGGKILTGAFSYCSMLTEVVLPDGLTEIADMAFCDCTNLATVNIPATVTKIGNQAFYNLAITSIAIPATVTEIGRHAFGRCAGLDEIVLPAGLLTIKYGAFEGCTGLTEFVIPASVTTMQDHLFNGCTSLTKLTLPTTMHQETYYGYTEISYRFGSLIGLAVPASLKTVVFNGSFTELGDYAFNECWDIESITLPNTVTTIGQNAFWNCSGLQSLELPANVKIIGRRAFSGCVGLTELVIPASVTSLGDQLFDSCSNLTTVCYGGTQTQWETAFAAVSLPTNAKVYYYSANETTTPGMWYYDESGNIVTVPHATV